MSTTPAVVKSLVDKLIHSVTGLTPQGDAENFSLCREFALRNFKGYKFARTNQFDVASKLSGLEEKLRIHNRDDLADALRSRLTELPSSGFTPEMLSLFLLLSDRPLEKASVQDLELPPAPRAMTWADIIAEDPLTGDIWGDVDFGAESSEEWSDSSGHRPRERDEFVEGLLLSAEAKRRRKKVGDGEEEGQEGYGVAGVEGFTVGGDEVGMQELKLAQYWAEKVLPAVHEIDVSLSYSGVTDISIVSELQAVREVLFMLLGHPCVLFQRSADGRASVPVTSPFGLRHSSISAFRAILDWYAEKGTSINAIRRFVGPETDSPDRQTFIAAVVCKLAILDQRLIDLEELVVVGSSGGSDQIVSLLALQGELEPFLRPFDLLSQIISNLPADSTTSPASAALQHLEKLFNAACALQSTGDNPSFVFIADIFFTCLQTYLRPIRQWMESGALHASSPTFLVSKTRSDDEVELAGLWHDQYSLRRDREGALLAPTFVHAVAERIFITGKSVVFLHRLSEHGIPSLAATTPTSATLPTAGEITLGSAYAEAAPLAPLADVFAAALERWIAARHHSVSSRLRNVLHADCGLRDSLGALEYIFLCRDGHRFDAFARAMFEKVDRGVVGWSDRFLLTELVQGVYSGVKCVHADRVRVRVVEEDDGKGKGLKEKRRTVNMWKSIELDYALPWPITNILRPPSLASYRSIFTLLLQLRRAQHTLTRLSLLKTPHTLDREDALYHALRHRLLWFVNIIYHYTTSLVLAPRTRALKAAMSRAVDVDGMVRAHDEHVRVLAEECLLNHRMVPMLKAITGVLDIAVMFSDARIAHVAALKGEEAGEDVSVFIERRRSSAGNLDLSDDDDDDEGTEVDVDVSFENEAYSRQIESMRARFETLVDFVKAGLRGVARAGVTPHLEALAEDLEGPGRGGGQARRGL